MKTHIKQLAFPLAVLTILGLSACSSDDANKKAFTSAIDAAFAKRPVACFGYVNTATVLRDSDNDSLALSMRARQLES